MTIVSLLDELVNALLKAEGTFLDNPKDFNSLEKSVKASTESFAAEFLGKVLSSVNEQICKSSYRIGRYTVVNGRFCPQSVRSFCPIVAGFNAGTYKVPACVL